MTARDLRRRRRAVVVSALLCSALACDVDAPADDLEATPHAAAAPASPPPAASSPPAAVIERPASTPVEADVEAEADVEVEAEAEVEAEVEATPDADAAAEDERAGETTPRYVATLGELVIQGGMDKTIVKRLFKQRRAALARCARKAAEAGEDPVGALELRLHLTDTRPEVKAVAIESNTTGSAKRLPRCVDRALRAWSWPTQYVCGAAVMRLRVDLRAVNE